MSHPMDLTIDDDGYQAPFKSNFPVIEYHMLDKTKYYPLVAASGIAVRSVVYPLTLIKTRMQVQKSRALYNGTFEAIGQIIKNEGVKGLYSGFLVHNCSMLSQITFLSTYEKIRHVLAEKHSFKSNQQRSFIAGGLACAITQTIVVPIDIVTQHLQTKSVYNELHFSKNNSNSSGDCQNKLVKSNFDNRSNKQLPRNLSSSSVTLSCKVNKNHNHQRFVYIGTKTDEFKQIDYQNARKVVVTIFKKHGIAGFYKGFVLSVITYSPTSAIWWLTYDTFCDFLSKSTPIWFPRLLIQCLAAPMSATTTTIATTPVDAIRTRIQVEKTSFMETSLMLWKEERWKIFVKALSPRLIQNVITSFFVILGYETIKKWSLLNEYKHHIHR